MRPRSAQGLLPVLSTLALLSIACAGSGHLKQRLHPPDFTVGTSTPNLSIPSGGNASLTLSFSRLNGFSEAVEVALEGAPAGVTGTGTLAPQESTLRLNLLVAPGTSPQPLPRLVLKATSSHISHALPLSLTITAALPPGSLPPGQAQASGGIQRVGTLENAPVVMEPTQSRTSQDATGTIQNRNGFKSSARPLDK